MYIYCPVVFDINRSLTPDILWVTPCIMQQTWPARTCTFSVFIFVVVIVKVFIYSMFFLKNIPTLFCICSFPLAPLSDTVASSCHRSDLSVECVWDKIKTVCGSGVASVWPGRTEQVWRLSALKIPWTLCDGSNRWYPGMTHIASRRGGEMGWGNNAWYAGRSWPLSDCQVM